MRAPIGPRNDSDQPRQRKPRAKNSSEMGAATEKAITKSHNAPSARADFNTSPMNPGSTSRPVARDTKSQPITRTNSATTPIKRPLHGGKRTARKSETGF